MSVALTESSRRNARRPLVHRRASGDQLATGVRVIDCLLPLRFGARVALVAEPESFRAAMLGWIVRQSSADATLLVLPGRRPQEVRTFVDAHLTPDSLARTGILSPECSKEAPAAVMRALGKARNLQDEGRDVLLIVDCVSVLEHAADGRAAVDAVVGAAGEKEPGGGSLTILLAIDATEDEGSQTALGSRWRLGRLDASIILRRDLAERGYFPPIDPLASWSRAGGAVRPLPVQAAAQRVRDLLRDYAAIEEQLDTAAYRQGRNRAGDLALRTRQAVLRFLQQSPRQAMNLQTSRQQLLELDAGITQTADQIDTAYAARSAAKPSRSANTIPDQAAIRLPCKPLACAMAG